MKRKVLFIVVCLTALLSAYLFENFYLVLNAAIRQTGTYKSNTGIPRFIETLTPGTLMSLKAAGNALQVLWNVLCGYVLITIWGKRKTFRRFYLKTALIFIFLLITTFFVLSIFPMTQSAVHWPGRLVQLTRSPFLVLSVVFVIFIFENEVDRFHGN